MINRVEEERKKRKEKQEELAMLVGVSRQTIIAIEKGKYHPSLVLAFKLARHFEMPIEELFLYEEG